MKIYFVRHGETEWNRQERFQGRMNSPLTEKGRGEAEQMAEELKSQPITAVYASSLGRAQETAAAIAKAKGLEVGILPAFDEICMGDLEGRTRGDFERLYPEEHRLFMASSLEHSAAAYEGEDFHEIQARVEEGLAELQRKHGEDETIVVVSHGMTLMLLFSYLRHKNLEHMGEEALPKNTAYKLVEAKNGNYQIIGE